MDRPPSPTALPAVDPSQLQPKSLLNRKEYLTGIGLLLLVVILWTSSNFVTQDLYEGGYDKPFLVTFLNTSSFSIYLVPFLIRRRYSLSNNSVAKRRLSHAHGSDDEYQPLALEEPSEARLSEEFYSPARKTRSLPPLSDTETAHLALSFCLIWFIANWSVNASLRYTSVASATILSSMSGFFTLAIGSVFRVEKLSLIKIGAVTTSFVGVALVSMSDSQAKQPGQTSIGHAFNMVVVFGDFLALISALFYAMYVTLLKVRIKSESRIDMQLFFGFVGLFNIIGLWPIGVLLHLTGAETFELPSTAKAMSALLINMAITVSSDYIYVLAMLKTTPLVVTIGLSLTIPFAVLGDFLRSRPTHFIVGLGALLVLCSFVAIGLEDSDSEEDDQMIENPTTGTC
ncbi:hypothetical protein CPC08DRAFT_677317 [Agrocybe pediades]|nr:hypothetical protein CPC08DRAFT_677317 [Agrocybe pediades]